MLTIKNRAAENVVFFLLLATFFTGCMPPGPRALLDGRDLIEEQRYDEAIEKLKVATSILSTNAQAWNYFAIACHHAGQVTNAETAYLKALALDRDLVEAHYGLGCLRLEQNRLEPARTEFIAFTTLRGESADGWVKLGTTQLRLRDSAGAEKSAAEALRLDAQNPEAWNLSGVLQLQRGRAVEGAQCFEKALKLQPDYDPALLNLAIVLQYHLNNRAAALQRYREYLALPATAANRDIANAAVKALEQELNIAPAPVPSNVVTQQAVAANPPQKQMLEAPIPPPTPKPVVVVTNTSRTAPLPFTQTNLEVVRVPADPVVKPAQEVSVKPPPQPARTNVQTAVRTNKEVAKTEKRGLLQQMNPMNLFRNETQSVTRTTSGTNTVAITSSSYRGPRYAYRRPAKPASGNRSSAEPIFTQAVQNQQSNHLAEAIQGYRRAIQQDPAYFEAYYNLGLAATASGNLSQALAAYEGALAIRPDSLDARYNFALVLKQAGYVLDSASELERILASYPNEPRAHLILGNLYAQSLGEPAKARDHYLQVLKEDPRNPQAPAIRYWLAANPP